MKKRFSMRPVKRLTALFLCILLLSNLLCGAGLAEEGSGNQTDAYLEGLFRRTEKHFQEAYAVTGLTEDDSFSYAVWAEELEAFQEESWEGRLFLWAAHELTGTELDTASYVTYLSNIMAMMEKGLIETTAAQASYCASDNLGNRITDFGGVTVEKLLGSSLMGELKKPLELLMDGKKLTKLAAQSVETTGEAAILTSYGQIYQKKLAFLEEVRDHTEDAKLKEAAEDLIAASSLQLVYILENYSTELIKAAGTLAWDITNPSDMKFLEQVSVRVAEKIGPWLDQLLKKSGEKVISGTIVLGIKKTALFLGLMQTGFEIGGAVGALVWGDDLECFREMRSMKKISDALSDSVSESARQARKETDSRKRYESIFRMVACGEALAYVRLRGEHCALESIRGKEEAPEDIDGIDQYISGQIAKYYHALAMIFPEPAERVVIYGEAETLETGSMQSVITTPVVSITGREEIAEKINGSAWIQEYVDEQRAVRADVESYPAMYGLNHSISIIDDCYAVKGAVSISMGSYYYAGGAHGSHQVYSAVFDMENGEQLSFSDLFRTEDEASKQRMRDLLIQSLNQATNHMEGMFLDAPSAVDEAFQDRYFEKNWSLTREGLCMVYQEYSIAPHAGGLMKAVVPYDELAGIIKEEYLPEDVSGRTAEGSVCLWFPEELEEAGLPGGEGQGTVYGTADEGVLAAVSPSGRLFDVFIRNLSSHSDSVKVDAVCCYISRMESQDVIWIPKERPSFGEEIRLVVEETIKSEAAQKTDTLVTEYTVKDGVVYGN
ncbi:MAG: DUF3298 domain-containing protein [Lachnospiraceae bacterium]|nr:DUF3298 domain-containing protein [Lachnospiraceae bacterium]